MLQRDAKILRKSWTLWVGCANVIDGRQTGNRRQTELRWQL